MRIMVIFVLLMAMVLAVGCEEHVPEEVAVEIEEEEYIEQVKDVEKVEETEEKEEKDKVEETEEKEEEKTEEEQVEEEEEETEEKEEEPQLDCPGTNPASGTFDVEISIRFGSEEGTAEPIVQMEGKSGTISFEPEEAFEERMGVEWYQYDLNIHKDDCDGELIDKIPFRWEDGDKDKSKDFEVPERGCYCIKVTQEDLSAYDADIEMTSGDKFTLDFTTE